MDVVHNYYEQHELVDSVISGNSWHVRSHFISACWIVVVVLSRCIYTQPPFLWLLVVGYFL